MLLLFPFQTSFSIILLGFDPLLLPSTQHLSNIPSCIHFSMCMHLLISNAVNCVLMRWWCIDHNVPFRGKPKNPINLNPSHDTSSLMHIRIESVASTSENPIICFQWRLRWQNQVKSRDALYWSNKYIDRLNTYI